MNPSLLDTEWIWHPDWIDHGSGTAGGFVHFRKELDLENIPAEPLKIQITADTKYKLFVNCQLVHAGPVKGDEHMWFYDEVDVQPWLKTGVNVFSVRVLRFFYATSHATSFPRLSIPGLFVRTPDLRQRALYGLQSDTTWQSALDHYTVLRIDQKEDDFLHTYEDVDTTRGLNLSWTSARCLELPKSHGLAPPWVLSPRMIPPATSGAARFTTIHNVRSALPRSAWEELLLGPEAQTSSYPAKTLRLPSGTSHHIEIEAEHHLTAMLLFMFERPAYGGSCLRITYSECYEDEPEQIPYLRKKGNRTDSSKQLYGPQDRYVFSGKAGAQGAHGLAYARDTESDEDFTPFHFRTLRFLAIDIDVPETGDLIMKGLRMSTTHYPLKVLGSFELPSSNAHAEIYHRTWETSVRTLVNCMHDCYEDCPFYEQLQYAMDLRSSCLFTYAISGDDRMARQAITQMHNSYRPSLGLIASRSPAHQLQVILHFSLFWICTVTDHYEHFADGGFTRRFVSTCDSILEYFSRRIDPGTGLIQCGIKDIGTTWDFVDWANEWRPMGIPPAAQSTGFQTFTNMIYTYTLQNLARVVRALGRPALGEEYTTRAQAMIGAVRRHCWDGINFTDGLASIAVHEEDLSQHNQIWAVLCGAVENDEARTLLRRALFPTPPPEPGAATSHGQSSTKFTKASTAMSLYALRALSKVGDLLYDDAFHAFWDPWRHQLSQNLTTWCEDDVSLRSDCHAWCSTPLYEFMVEVAGIKPAAPGWEAISFKPRVNLFPEFNAKVPLSGVAAGGIAHVSWMTEAEGAGVLVSLQLHSVPKAIPVHVIFPDGHIEEHSGPVVSVRFDVVG